MALRRRRKRSKQRELELCAMGLLSSLEMYWGSRSRSFLKESVHLMAFSAMLARGWCCYVVSAGNEDGGFSFNPAAPNSMEE